MAAGSGDGYAYQNKSAVDAIEGQAVHHKGFFRIPRPGKLPSCDSTKDDRKRISDLLSDTHKLLVELGKLDVRDATDEFRKKRADLEQRLKDEREYIDKI